MKPWRACALGRPGEAREGRLAACSGAPFFHSLLRRRAGHGLFVRRGGLGRGRQRPAAAALHRGGDAEAALPAARAPDDGALLGEMHGQTWAQAGQPSRDLLCELCGTLHRHQPVYPQPVGADAEI